MVNATSSSGVDVSVGDLMSPAPMCVRPETTIETAMGMLVGKGVSGMPVVNDAGRPIGVVSKTDLVRDHYERGDTGEVITGSSTADRFGPGFHVEQPVSGTVTEIMQPCAFTVDSGAPMTQAAALMAYEGVHRLPVVSEAGAVVGVLSAMDIVRWVAESARAQNTNKE